MAARHRRAPDRFERAGPDFHARVVDGFRTMATADPERWVVIDATGDIDEVARDVRRAVTDRLPCSERASLRGTTRASAHW